MPIRAAEEVVPESVSWLWPGRIPLGKLVMLDGDPDLGKSLLALDFCARLSTGRPFPEGGPAVGPANALVLSAEDSAADTVVPRLKRLGADLRRVFVWQAGGPGEEWPWRFPAHLDRLDDARGKTEPRLAVIDPVMAFLGARVQTSTDASVRQVLSPLARLGERHRCTLMMHRHLTKKAAARATYRGLGAIGFVAASRYAMLVARDPADPGRCVLAQVRNSLGGAQPSLVYRLAAAGGELPTVEWLGTSPLGADDLLASARLGGGPRDQAALFLEHFLAGGPRTSRELWEAARKARLSARTLNRAKRDLGIRSLAAFEGGRPVSYWLLPGQAMPRGDMDPELARTLDELERQFPPPTPLDEDEGFPGERATG